MPVFTKKHVLNAAVATGITAAESLAVGAGLLSSEIDNRDGKYDTLDLQLTWTVAGTAVANETLDVYVVAAVDGTNYEDGGTSVKPAKTKAGSFVNRAVSTAQKTHAAITSLPPCKFKLLLWNGMTAEKTATALTLAAYPRVEFEVQG